MFKSNKEGFIKSCYRQSDIVQYYQTVFENNVYVFDFENIKNRPNELEKKLKIICEINDKETKLNFAAKINSSKKQMKLPLLDN